MTTSLDRLLEAIDPSRTLDQTQARADQAINTFALHEAIVQELPGFRKVMVEFLYHLEYHILRLRTSVRMSGDFNWNRCVQVLVQEFGKEGEKAAFEMARTGSEGGLLAVQRRMALRVAETYTRNEISARVYDYWNHLSVPQMLDASSEYLEKFGHLLPSDLTEGSAARLRANLPRVLEEHPFLIQRLRAVGR